MNVSINMLLVHSRGTLEVRVLKSTVKHPVLSMSCYAKVKLGKKSLVWYYSGTLSYQKFYGRQHDDRIFEVWALLMTVRPFQIYSVNI